MKKYGLILYLLSSVAFVCLLSSVAFAQLDKDARIKKLEATVANDNIEKLYKDIQLQQTQAQEAVDKYSTKLTAPIQELSKQLDKAMADAKKSQGVPSDYVYNMGTHSWEKPAPVKAADGSAVKGPENKSAPGPETKQ